MINSLTYSNLQENIQVHKKNCSDYKSHIFSLFYSLKSKIQSEESPISSNQKLIQKLGLTIPHFISPALDDLVEKIKNTKQELAELQNRKDRHVMTPSLSNKVPKKEITRLREKLNFLENQLQEAAGIKLTTAQEGITKIHDLFESMKESFLFLRKNGQICQKDANEFEMLRDLCVVKPREYRVILDPIIIQEKLEKQLKMAENHRLKQEPSYFLI